jgi:microcystin-dependent protein
MGSQYIGEIRMFAGTFAPVDWAFCNGQILAISQNEALFNLIGTTYGGDGQNTFALPNLQSRIPFHQGAGFVIGQAAGSEQVTLTSQQVPAHTHAANCFNGDATQGSPSGNVWSQSTLEQYSNATPVDAMNPAALGPAGGSLPHDNMTPYLVVNFIIALFGVFPSQN